MPRIKKAADTVRQPSLEDQRARSAHCPIVGQPQADYSRKQRSARALNHHLANATFFEHAGSAKRSGEMLRAAAPKVRIQLPPAKSLRTSGPSPQAVQARIRADRNKRPVFAVIRGRSPRFGNEDPARSRSRARSSRVGRFSAHCRRYRPAARHAQMIDRGMSRLPLRDPSIGHRGKRVIKALIASLPRPLFSRQW
jgi:hypothetical protein